MSAWNQRISTIAFVVLSTGFLATSASASALTVDFFTLGPNNPDVGNSIDGVTTGLVNTTLGPDGLPVASAASFLYPLTSSNHLNDLNASNELLWWTPGPNVTAAGSSTITLPYDQHLFPNGINNGADGYTSAHLYGTFNLASPGGITLTLGSDDDAWVFINGQLVVDNGGVHAFQNIPFPVSTGLLVGTNTIDVFFADRHVVQSELAFDANVTIFPRTESVPEPLTLSLFGAGLAGAAAMRRRKKMAA